jgi:hypothetical protein
VTYNAWTAIVPIPVAGPSPSLAFDSANSKLYALRGFTTTTAWVYTVNGRTWSAIAAVPSALNGGGLAFDSANSMLYALGLLAHTAWAYTPRSNTWTAIARVPGPTNYGMALAFDSANSKLYALRGSNTTTAWAYTVNSNAWTAIAPLPVAARNPSLACDSRNSKLYALLGGGTSTVLVYTLLGNTWSATTSTPAPVTAGALAFDSANSKLYALGGSSTTTAWSYLPVSAPYAPYRLTPLNGSGRAPGPVLCQSTYSSTDSLTANAYALQMKTATAASFSYWNASTGALQSTIVWNAATVATGASFGVTLPASLFVASKTYQWSMAYQESGANLQGPFASPYTFTVESPAILSVTAPTGSVTTGRPLVQYTARPASGTSITHYRVVIYSAAQHASSSFVPGDTPNIWDSGKVGGNPGLVRVGVTLESGVSYYAYVQVWESYTVASAWAYSTFTATYDTPAAPTLTAMATVMPETTAPVVLLKVQSHTNLLSAAEANFETGIGTWITTYASDFDLSVSTAWAAEGHHSLQIACVVANIPNLHTNGSVPCEPNTVYTFIASVRTVATVRNWNLKALWSTSLGSFISEPIAAPGMDSTTGTRLRGVLTSPPTAAHVQVVLTTTAAWEGELSAPAAPTVAPHGTAGSTHYAYVIVVTSAYGTTLGSAPGSTTTGNAVLSATNYNHVSWTAVVGGTRYQVYREHGTVFDLIGASTTNSFNDVGQTASPTHPPTVNTSGETHNIDAVGIFPGSVTNWSAGGLLPNSTVFIEATINGQWSQVTAPATFTQITAVATVYDYTAPHGVQRTYHATLQTFVNGIPQLAPHSNEVGVTTLPNNWWFYDVADPSLSCHVYRAQSIAIIYGATAKTSFSETRKTTSQFIEAFTRPTYIEVLGTVMNPEFDLVVDFFTTASLERFLALWQANVSTGHVILAKSDMTHTIYWINFGSTRPIATLRGATRTTMPVRQLAVHCYPATPAF